MKLARSDEKLHRFFPTFLIRGNADRKQPRIRQTRTAPSTAPLLKKTGPLRLATSRGNPLLALLAGKPARATTNIRSLASTTSRSIPTEPAMTSRNGAVTSAAPSALTRGSAPFDWHRRERPALALLAGKACTRSEEKATLHPSEVNWNYKSRKGNTMSGTLLAYLISLGIIGAGVVWIVAGVYPATSAICIVVGVPTIVVGLLSFFTELRNR